MPQSVLFYAAVPLQTHPPNGERRPDGHVLWLLRSILVELISISQYPWCTTGHQSAWASGLFSWSCKTGRLGAELVRPPDKNNGQVERHISCPMCYCSSHPNVWLSSPWTPLRWEWWERVPLQSGHLLYDMCFRYFSTTLYGEPTRGTSHPPGTTWSLDEGNFELVLRGNVACRNSGPQ